MSKSEAKPAGRTEFELVQKDLGHGLRFTLCKPDVPSVRAYVDGPFREELHGFIEDFMAKLNDRLRRCMASEDKPKNPLPR